MRPYKANVCLAVLLCCLSMSVRVNAQRLRSQQRNSGTSWAQQRAVDEKDLCKCIRPVRGLQSKLSSYSEDYPNHGIVFYR